MFSNQEYQLLRRRYVNTPALWGDELLIVSLVEYALMVWLSDEALEVLGDVE